MRRLQNGPLSQMHSNPKLKQFLTNCTKLYRNKQLADEQLSKLESLHEKDFPENDLEMQFEEGMSTIDSMTAASLNSHANQTMLFDIMQS